jgi:hypothetical protein
MASAPHHVSATFEAWRLADAHARELEMKMASAWKAFDKQLGPAPDESLFAQVAVFRAIALERLSAVLEEMKTATSHEPNEVKGSWHEQHPG